MRLKLKSIRGKVFFLYMSLSLINISLFSVIIYENQIDLIVDNSILQYSELTGKIAEHLQFSTLKTGLIRSSGKGDTIRDILPVIEKHVDKFIIVSTGGKLVLNQGVPDIISETDIANSLKAVTARNFAGDLFFSYIDHSKTVITFYIPIMSSGTEAFVLIFSRSLESITAKMKDLYREMIIVAVFLALFHIIIAIVFYKMLIYPLSKLYRQTRIIAAGDYSARAEIRSSDEIGELADSFNVMAESIQEKIIHLEEYNTRMENELALAGEVQKSIFPELADGGRFRFNVFSKPYGRVSGDYYDSFSFEDGSQAFLIADVSGHGVPAALMTMTLKENFGMHAHTIKDPAGMFRMLNEKVFAMFEAGNISPRYFSGFYMIIDAGNTMLYCNAGHPQPILISKHGVITRLDTDGGVVGIFSNMGDYYSTENTRLESGDKIILITDGVLEAMNENSEQYGWERITGSICDCAELTISDTVKRMISALSEFTDIDKLQDDATIIGIELL